MYKKKYIKLLIVFLFIFGIFYFRNTAYAATIRQGKVTATAGLRLRSGPTTNSGIILTVPYNATVRVEEDSTSGNGCSDKWVKAVYNNDIGYLCSDYLEITEVDGEEVSYNKIDTALQSIGVSLKDANGQFRDLDQVFLDISAKFS